MNESFSLFLLFFFSFFFSLWEPMEHFFLDFFLDVLEMSSCQWRTSSLRRRFWNRCTILTLLLYEIMPISLFIYFVILQNKYNEMPGLVPFPFLLSLVQPSYEPLPTCSQAYISVKPYLRACKAKSYRHGIQPTWLLLVQPFKYQ